MTVSRLFALVALAFCFVAGYLLAGLWSSARDTSPLAQICARVDYVNGLQENLKGQEAASEEVQTEVKALVEQCRTALRDRADEND
jgi:hypothetical protein